VFAGVDYRRILNAAEAEADVILWDGGNNDTPFIKPSLHIVVTDPHRAGHESSYYPGETNLLMADMVVINKIGTALPEDVQAVESSVHRANPNAIVVKAESPVTVDDESAIKGKRALVIEDGPTVTHGEMRFGAGHVAARRCGASEIVDPRPYAQGTIRQVFEKYTHLTDVLPAMGYGKQQIDELAATIARVPCDVVIVGTPIDLRRLIEMPHPSVRVRYELKEQDPNVLPESVRRVVAG